MTSSSFSNSSLLPRDRSGEPGKSMPMMDTFTDFSMVGVHETRNGLKFVHVTSEKFFGRFTILIFMDNKLTEMEIEEWKDFSNHMKDFKNVGASVVGVCTDSHITMRTWMMSFLQGVKFPIISDRDGDFSRAFGVLKVKDGQFGAARALVILDKEMRMVHMSLHNEYTRSYPEQVVELIKHFKGEGIDAADTAIKAEKSDNSKSGSTQSRSSNTRIPASIKKHNLSSKSISVFTNNIQDSSNKSSSVFKKSSSRVDSNSSKSNPDEAQEGSKTLDQDEHKEVNKKVADRDTKSPSKDEKELIRKKPSVARCEVATKTGSQAAKKNLKNEKDTEN